MCGNVHKRASGKVRLNEIENEQLYGDEIVFVTSEPKESSTRGYS